MISNKRKRNNSGDRTELKRKRKHSRTSISKQLSDSQAYPGQQKVKLTLPGIPIIYSTTVTTGVISAIYPIDKTQILDFALRFGSTFDEYRILGANMKIRALNMASGITSMFFDEKSFAVPSSNDAQERTSRLITNNSSDPKSVTTMRWSARDLLDLQYTAIGTLYLPVTFKIYTDSTNWGSPVTVTQLFLVACDLIIEFRGLAST
jgi:hypothetical protein